VMQDIGWKERKAKKAPNRGVGIACGSQISGLRMGGHFASSALVKVAEDGTVNLIHGGTEIGQGCDTVFSQMVAEVLGIPAEHVIVGAEDGYDTFFDSGMFGDRCTVWTGNAVVAAAEDAKRQLAAVAAEMLSVKPEELVFRDRKVYVKGDPEKSLPFLRVVRNAQYGKGYCIYGHGSWAPPGVEVADFEKGDASNLTPSYSFVAQAVEVEVDPETGKVKVLNSITGDDSGRPMNELLVDGQIEGGAVHMIGQGLFEQSLWDEKGRPLNPSFMDYKMPTAMDSPKFTNYHIITDDPRGPFGAKGAGETATTTMMAAITNAVYDAVGVRITEPPITAEKVYMALKQKKGKR
jgi:CO/xanthine dehydrogenase Mo-binding subunit